MSTKQDNLVQMYNKLLQTQRNVWQKFKFFSARVAGL